MPGAAKLERQRVAMVRRGRLEHSGEARSVVLLELGLRGGFVQWDGERLPIDEAVRLSFRLPGDPEPIKAGCRVAWWNDATKSPTSLPDGMGLQFVQISEKDHLRLRAYLEEHARQDPSTQQFTRA